MANEFERIQENEKIVNLLKELIVDQGIGYISSDYDNESIHTVFHRVFLHEYKLLYSALNLPYIFPRPKHDRMFFRLSENNLYFTLIKKDYLVNSIKKMFNNDSIAVTKSGEEAKIDFEQAKQVETPEELKEKYPDLYDIYDTFIKQCYKDQKIMFDYCLRNDYPINEADPDGFYRKSLSYKNNFKLFLNDLCDYYRILYENADRLNDILDKDLKSARGQYNEYLYNILFAALIKLFLDHAYDRRDKSARRHNYVLKEYINWEKMPSTVKKVIMELYNYNPGLYLNDHWLNCSKTVVLEDFFRYYIDDIVREQQDNINSDMKMSNNDTPVDYTLYARGGDCFSIPFFFKENDVLKTILHSSINDPVDPLVYFIVKYSGIFEYSAENHDLDYSGEDLIYLSIKKEYDGMQFDDVFNICMENLRKHQERDVDFISSAWDEDKIIKFINDPKKEYKIYNILLTVLKTGIKFPITLLEQIGFYSAFSFLMCHFYFLFKEKMNDMRDLDMITSYMHFRINYFNGNVSFIKFIDKSYLKSEDFIKMFNEIEAAIIDRIGKEKLDEIKEKTKDLQDYSDVNKIVQQSLLKKKSIDDEIRNVEKIKSKTPSTDPIYKSLNQRLNKLKLYKEHFDSEEVLDGEGLIFENYYGFEFDGVYVFDYFTDMDTEDQSKKALKDYGNRIYILTADDYLELLDLIQSGKITKKMELNKYIKEHFEPCAALLNHSEDYGNFERNLLRKVKAVKDSVKKKEYVINLSKTDNPVTDEELIKKLKIKSQKFQSNESLMRDKNVSAVNHRKKDDKPKAVLDEDDQREFIDEIEVTLVELQKINDERCKKGLKPLSFDSDNYYDVYGAIIEYEEKHNVKRSTPRDTAVAIKTKARTFFDNEYHCELCGESSIDPLYFDSHHFIPISLGGPDDIYNTVCLCTKCHRDIHNGRVTDYQNYQLIQKIRNNIICNTPEALPIFERTLGFKDNSYIEQLELTEEEIESINASIKTAEADMDDPDREDKLSRMQDEKAKLEKRKQKLNELANRIQDYYNYSNEVITEEERVRSMKID